LNGSPDWANVRSGQALAMTAAPAVFRKVRRSMRPFDMVLLLG
jgi:hypothetical protein